MQVGRQLAPDEPALVQQVARLQFPPAEEEHHRPGVVKGRPEGIRRQQPGNPYLPGFDQRQQAVVLELLG